MKQASFQAGESAVNGTAVPLNGGKPDSPYLK
jgi:hypothetical protein